MAGSQGKRYLKQNENDTKEWGHDGWENLQSETPNTTKKVINQVQKNKSNRKSGFHDNKGNGKKKGDQNMSNENKKSDDTTGDTMIQRGRGKFTDLSSLKTKPPHREIPTTHRNSRADREIYTPPSRRGSYQTIDKSNSIEENTTKKNVKPDAELIILLEVEIGNNTTVNCYLHQGENIIEVATCFCKENNLSLSHVSVLEEHFKEALKNIELLEKQELQQQQQQQQQVTFKKNNSKKNIKDQATKKEKHIKGNRKSLANDEIINNNEQNKPQNLPLKEFKDEDQNNKGNQNHEIQSNEKNRNSFDKTQKQDKKLKNTPTQSSSDIRRVYKDKRRQKSVNHGLVDNNLPSNETNRYISEENQQPKSSGKSHTKMESKKNENDKSTRYVTDNRRRSNDQTKGGNSTKKKDVGTKENDTSDAHDDKRKTSNQDRKKADTNKVTSKAQFYRQVQNIDASHPVE